MLRLDWSFGLANNSPLAATLVLAKYNMRHRDSTGTDDPLNVSSPCGAWFSSGYNGLPDPVTLAPGEHTSSSISYLVKVVPGAATYVELQLLLSGTLLNCRLPLP